MLADKVIKIIELKASALKLKINDSELQQQKLLNHQANLRLNSFFNCSTNFHVLMDKKGEIMDYNKSSATFVSKVLNSKIVTGGKLLNYIHEDFVKKFKEKSELALKGKKTIVEGSTDYNKAGMVWWKAIFEPARDENGEIFGVSYLVINITEKKRKEQKIVIQNHSLSQIAHIHAHEFRGPLTTIMGLVDLMNEDHQQIEQYLLMLKQAVISLDKKIKKIINKIENSDIQENISDSKDEQLRIA